MNKKYTRYYIVTLDTNNTQYRKLESALPFSVQEGIDNIKQQAGVLDVKHIAKEKAEKFLKLL